MRINQVLHDLKTGKGIEPNPAYKGTEVADDMILAIGFDGETDINNMSIVQDHIKEHSGTLDVSTQDNQYIRTGKVTTKTGVSRKIKISGDRFVGDEFQDKALEHKRKFGTGSQAEVNYIYFSARTGFGEKGLAELAISTDVGGGAGDTKSFEAEISTKSMVTEFNIADETITPLP